jgi:hypothetical protein
MRGLSLAGGFGASLLAFVLPAACYFKLAPLPSDFRAVAWHGTGLVPNQAAMAGVLLIGVSVFVTRAALVVACLAGSDDEWCFRRDAAADVAFGGARGAGGGQGNGDSCF